MTFIRIATHRNHSRGRWEKPVPRGPVPTCPAENGEIHHLGAPEPQKVIPGAQNALWGSFPHLGGPDRKYQGIPMLFQRFRRQLFAFLSQKCTFGSKNRSRTEKGVLGPIKCTFGAQRVCWPPPRHCFLLVFCVSGARAPPGASKQYPP